MSTTTRTPQSDYLGLLVAGYTMAFVLPIGGLVVAFVLGDRRGLGHPMAIACLSVICGFGWFFLLATLLSGA